MAARASKDRGHKIVRHRPDASAVLLEGSDRAVQVIPSTRIRRVQSEEIEQGLELFLTDGTESRQEIADKIRFFQQLAQREHYDLSRLMVGLYQGQIVHACLLIDQPGRSAFLFTSPVRAHGSAGANFSSLACQTLRSTCQWSLREGASLIQVITEPDDTNRNDLCRRSGFRPLTDLIYLLRPDNPAPAIRPSLPEGMRWLTYAPEHKDLFTQAIGGTYEDSQDCPELSDLRDMADVVESHQGAGHFQPELWQVLLQNDQPLGVLILSPLRSQDAMELTYMGLIPSARSKGLGKLLLRETFYQANRCGNLPLTLAVDCRNTAAYRLYTGAGFQAVMRRRVFILSSRWL
jgi:mycothiol synthase